MEVQGAEQVDPRITAAIGDMGVLIADPDTKESGKIPFTEQDEEIFAEAFGKFLAGRNELAKQIKAGTIIPKDSIATERKLLEQYRKDLKALGSSE